MRAGRFCDYDTLLVWGYGKEGRAVLSLARAEAPRINMAVVDRAVPDDLPEGVAHLDEDALEAAVRAGGRVLIVKSPGVSLYDARLSDALRAGAQLTSQTNLWFERKPAAQRVIGVTGTKGKSTSSALLHHMLRALGEDAVLAGNIGEPVIETPASASIVVAELSSYQCADLVHGPDYGVIINLMREHIPWHRSLEAYQRDKARLASLDPNTRAVLNAGDANLASVFANRPNTLWYNTPGGFHAPGGVVHRGGEVWGPIPSVPGPHNALNACAGLTVIADMGLDARAAFDSLSGFHGLPHRLQTVAVKGEVRFVDDSLATTPEALLLALEAFPGEDVALILGGEEREQDYDGLAASLERHERIRAIITIPENGPRIGAALAGGRHAAVWAHETDFDRAVARAAGALTKGVVLLSPAAPRGRQFTVFGARGRAFAAAAQALPEA
ncbi:MAG: UDP-N-acetylmuramoyl-L-alanine--D-glutamate ligase [Alphaproteobacteria bacterium]|nr:UDP-N-acetylmuramoyl-L-alanine--D-glutamate ligase [Alphaproteobacteria bacterium]